MCPRHERTLRDLIHAWRGLTQKPGFFIGALLTVAIGISANVAIFSLVNAISLRPMPFGERTDRLATIHVAHRLNVDEPGWGDTEISYADFLDFRKATTIEGIGGYLTRSYLLTGDAYGAERIRGGSVTPDLLPLLGIEPIMGRQFTMEEAASPGLESVVMLTHTLWQRRFGSDPAIIGKSIIVNDRARVVVGVLPPGFRFPEFDELYTPLRWDEAPRSARNINAVALLRPGESIERARAELMGIARRLEETYPETNRGYGVRVIPIRDSYIGADDRAHRHRPDVGGGIRAADHVREPRQLDAGARRIAAAGAGSARGDGRRAWPFAVGDAGRNRPHRRAWRGHGIADVAVDCRRDDPRIPGGLTAVLARLHHRWTRRALFDRRRDLHDAHGGLLPALRTVRPNLVTDLKEGARGVSLGLAGQRLQAGLVVAQVALCFALLVGANLMVQSFLAMQRTSLGFDDRPMLTGAGYLAGDAYDDLRARTAFYRQVVDNLRSIPGVAAAAVTTATPGDDGGSGQQLVIDGRTSAEDAIGVQSIAISPELFDTLGLPLIAGRTFTDVEMQNHEANVAILNQELAERLWPGESALNRRIGFRDNDDILWLRVIGVVPNVHYEEIGEDTDQSRLNVYVPYAQSGSRSMAMLVRAHGAPETLVAPIRDAMRRIGPTFAVFRSCRCRCGGRRRPGNRSSSAT